jgi:hypothetical protein
MKRIDSTSATSMAARRSSALDVFLACAVVMVLLVGQTVNAQTSSDAVVGTGGGSVSSVTTGTGGDGTVQLPTSPESAFASTALADQPVSHLGATEDRLLFTVVNNTKTGLNYQFNSAQQFDVTIVDSTGKVVWVWSKDRVFDSLVTHLKLEPGQAHVYRIRWDRRDNTDIPVPAGTYTATATLLSQPSLVLSKTSTFDPSMENRDPTNVNLPSPSAQDHNPQSGGQQESDIEPAVTAKTTIVVGSRGD